MKKIIITLLIACLLLSTIPLSIAGKEMVGTISSNIDGSLLYNSSCESSFLSEYVPGELIIGFKNDVKVDLLSSTGKIKDTGILSIDNLNRKYDVKSAESLMKDESNSSLSNIYKLTLRDYNIDVLTVAKDYEANQYVEFVEPNYIGSYCDNLNSFKKSQSTQGVIANNQYFNKNLNNLLPNDPYFHLQWGLHNTGQTGGVPDVDIDAPEAWDLETGNGEVVIAVIDSGIDYTHPDLAGNIWINNAEDINHNGRFDNWSCYQQKNGVYGDIDHTDNDGNGFIDDVVGWDFLGSDNDPRDYFGHGTHCAGIAAAVTNNDEGIAGVCWNCKIMPIRVCHYKLIPGFTAAEGVIYAANNGADIISISLGWTRTIYVLNYAINYAYDKGAVIVAAAGNGGNHGVPILTFPGRHDKVISVGAINHYGERYYLSSWGPSLDIVAPGENIFSTLPNYHVLFNDFGLNQSYDNLSGTSMACPHVAGVAALILSHNSTLKNYEVRDILQSTATDLGTEGKDWYFGYGLVNAYSAVQKSDNYTNLNNFYYGVESNQIINSYQFICSSPYSQEVTQKLDNR